MSARPGSQRYVARCSGIQYYAQLLTATTYQLFAALSETLQNQVRSVATEKKTMIDEAQKIIAAIRQMEASLEGTKPRRDQRSRGTDDDDLQITYPLSRCLQALKEKHTQISRLHRDRFEQVKSKLDHTHMYFGIMKI